jgi:transcriptional regulator with XRE-family HTH domain
MARTTPPLLPRMRRLLEQVGTHLKLARLRRRDSAQAVAQRAGISRKTLYRAEQGDPAVSLGIYARVLQALRLEQDLAKLAADDELGRTLQDAGLITPRRAPKRPAQRPDQEVAAADDSETP